MGNKRVIEGNGISVVVRVGVAVSAASLVPVAAGVGLAWVPVAVGGNGGVAVLVPLGAVPAMVCVGVGVFTLDGDVGVTVLASPVLVIVGTMTGVRVCVAVFCCCKLMASTSEYSDDPSALTDSSR